MGWFSELLKPDRAKSRAPAGFWQKCPHCAETVSARELADNLKVCPRCRFHFRIGARERIEQLVDPGSFVEIDRDLVSEDPLRFTDTEPYVERYRKAVVKLEQNDAIFSGTARLSGRTIALGAMDFHFMGGSMGSVVGEKVTRLIENATANRLPLVIVATSGGARMQEGILSLMQMAKTAAALARHDKAGLLYVSVLADPTTGGVTASFAMLGDLNLVEPGALVGFAGPRVIETTFKQKLPDGFQRAEFLHDHGVVDMVVPRPALRATLSQIFRHLLDGEDAEGETHGVETRGVEAAPPKPAIGGAA